MFIENSDPRQPHRHDFLLRCRPYRGELPTVAGLLLYPDAPAKMETTSQEAFCSRPLPQRDRGKGSRIAASAQQEPRPSHSTSSRQTGRGNSSSSSRDGEAGEEVSAEMKSQYQKDFPPPSSSSCRRRRTPACPQPDNIGINPAFRIDFNTVQKETYPSWRIVKLRTDSRLDTASSSPLIKAAGK